MLKNHASDIIFCDHASDVQYESGYVVRSLSQVCGLRPGTPIGGLNPWLLGKAK